MDKFHSSNCSIRSRQENIVSRFGNWGLQVERANIESGDDAEHHFSLYVTKGVTGVLVGHVKELPEIIVQAETEDKIASEVNESVLFYWKHYPDSHDKMFPKHVSAKTEKQFGKKLQLKMIEVSAPIILISSYISVAFTNA